MDRESGARRDRPLPEGVEVRDGRRGQRLRITFWYQGARRRETLDIPATAGNIKYAARKRAEIMNAIERGTFDYAAQFPRSRVGRALLEKQTPKSVTVGSLVLDYIDHGRRTGSLSPSTIRDYVGMMNSRLVPEFGADLPNEVTQARVRDWIKRMALEVSPKRVRNVVGLLSAVMSRAATEEVIPSSPFANISLKALLPRRRSSRDEVDPFSDAEVLAILESARSDPERALWQFAFSSGLRTGELIALKWRDIDEAGGVVRVRDNVVDDEFGTVEKDTKTSEERELPLLPAALEAIRTMKPISRLAGSYVFIHPVTRKRFLSNHQLRESFWKKTLTLAGVRYRRPYQTRHTFASRLLMSGESELLVARLLGHTTVEMVRRHYGRYIRQGERVMLAGDYRSFGVAKAAAGGDEE